MLLLTRTLTFAGDQLAALQGVVERLEQRAGVGCLAGHWCDSESCFVKSLAWAVHRPVDPPAALARAPSWSWLAQERHVYYPQEAHYLRGPWMHVDWPVFGRSHYGLCLVKPLPGPGCFTRGLEFRIAVTELLAKGLRGEPLPDDIPWAVSTPAGNYVFAVRVGFYRSGDQKAWPDAADQRTFALLTLAAKVIIGWLRFDDMTHRPHSFTCCPMYASLAAVPCLVLAPLTGHSHTHKALP